ncbi:hypothetical protein LZ318_33935 [Saccharopolyspora indica]|uniref:hypothetical protein n=1 Tax=Saccharopolyspora indica TaxID=1229659 RepID=UPI0022EAB067|nr:hypothetical protein [Saccharopolyspora indica]MDA3647467.1 hypothetical protein [Saccharopolyspora indica]
MTADDVLRTRVRSTITALIVKPDSIEAQALIIDLGKATDRAADLLTASNPKALAALRRALAFAAADQPEECTTELVAAHHHLSGLPRH